MGAPPPPLRVKLTAYRLVFITTVISFGTVKTILVYKGQSIAPSTLEWVSGMCLTVARVNLVYGPMTELEDLTISSDVKVILARRV
jgi:hypothetical protein